MARTYRVQFSEEEMRALIAVLDHLCIPSELTDEIGTIAYASFQSAYKRLCMRYKAVIANKRMKLIEGDQS